MRRSVAMMAAVSVFALVGVASAIGASGKLNAKASTYDPGKTGIIVSAWKAHAGLPDAGGSDHGLVLQKNGPLEANAAAGALITGVDGMVANGSNWGWDYKTGTYCGAGAPRFNVITSDNVFHFLGGCANSTQSPAAPGWTHVSIDPSNPGQAFPPIVPGSVITYVDVTFDEPGQTVIDNIVVNGSDPMQKPGNN